MSLLFPVLLTSTAWGAVEPGPVPRPVLLLLLLAAAWLAAHLLVERAQQRFLALTGVEYIGLGMLFGPVMLPGMGMWADDEGARPLFAFVVGWNGFLAGVSLAPGELARETRSTAGSLLDAALRGGAASAVTLALLWWQGLGLHGDLSSVPIAVLAVGCAAAAPSAAAVHLLEARFPDRTSALLPFLRHWSPPASALAICGLGLGFALFHIGATIALRPPGPVEWSLFTVGIGLALALCFLLFLGRDRSPNKVFLASTGTLLFASGAAFFLHLSALAVNFVLGLALGQTTVGPQIRSALDRTVGPARLVLLLFAGTLWRPIDPVAGLLLPLAVLGARAAGGFVAGFVATLGSGLRGDLVRGTWAQGDVAVAIAVSLRIAYSAPIVDLVFHAILVAVVISELTAPRALRGLLIDAGEIDEDLGPIEPRRST